MHHYPDPSGAQRPTSVAEKVEIPASELRLLPVNCACGQQSTIEIVRSEVSQNKPPFRALA